MNIIKSYIVTNAAAAGGGGTVESFSSGNLSPLFTTSVANPTTTPALSFTAVNQNANLIYAGPATGPAAAPTFRALVAADLPSDSGAYWKTAGTSVLTNTTGINAGANNLSFSFTSGSFEIAGSGDVIIGSENYLLTLGSVFDLTSASFSVTSPAITFVGGAAFSQTVIFANNTGIDVETTVGSDILNIGTSNADVINIGYSGSTINITGTLAYQNVTNLQVTDKLFTVNKGGGVGSGVSSGFEIEENAIITGYFATNGTRNGWDFKAPAITGVATLSLASLTGNHTYTLPDTTGTIALTSNLILPAQGGTGIANDNSSTITISGNFATTFTVTAATGVTLPTTGTLATLAGSEILTNKTLSTGTIFSVIPTINDGITFTFNPSATVSGIIVGDLAGNPSSAVNGGIWYNTSTNSLNAFKGGTAQAIITTSSGLTANRISFAVGSSQTLTDSANLTFVTNRLSGTTLYLTLSAGTATAGTAPLKMTSGTNLTTPENGSFEYNGTNLFFTRTGAVRETIMCAIAVNAVSPTAPNRTISFDFGGTTYYIAAKTTND